MTREKALEIRKQFNNAVQAIPKNNSKIYGAFLLFDEWKPDIEYAANTKIRHDNLLYIVEMAHTSQSDWLPENTPTLYTVIPKPGESGDKDNPIEYGGNMELHEGLYYKQNGIKYYCFRGTGMPVYNPLADLVGLYVETVEI